MHIWDEFQPPTGWHVKDRAVEAHGMTNFNVLRDKHPIMSNGDNVIFTH